ncbi:porin family protein [Chryseobacterium potabilaquae]|uniref:Outer membrane protein beta-barrel domain-containing protein n=1 Tax=Chryseobacterium potabilaquae TaxID=2675057 RepID=A0A6N4X9I4_9FLAO|nr:porin family protein [Chryseobacterium potabilaquae]CAA7197652.1 hypothetical protein CHRY9293_03725 [Chryseobacterium potabilaquae]
MKKLLFIGVLSLLAANGNAQETKFGAKAGYSFSAVKVNEAQDDLSARSTSNKSTFYVGAFVEHKLSDKFGIQGELLYSPLGGKENVSESLGEFNFSQKSEIKFGTLLIPVSAKYFISESFSVAAGVNFGIILSAKQKTEVSGNFPEGVEVEAEDGEFDIKDNVKKLNLVPFVGVEYALENGLFFDARYNLGVSNLVKEGPGKVTNSFAQIGIGFKFGGN